MSGRDALFWPRWEKSLLTKRRTYDEILHRIYMPDLSIKLFLLMLSGSFMHHAVLFIVPRMPS